MQAESAPTTAVSIDDLKAGLVQARQHYRDVVQKLDFSTAGTAELMAARLSVQHIEDELLTVELHHYLVRVGK